MPDLAMRVAIIIATVAASCLPAALASADTDTDNKPVQSMRLDMDASKPLDNGCRYKTSVHGVITPTKSQDSGHAKTEPLVEPKIDVVAEVTCPSSSALRINDTVMATGPLTRSQLERALERRATVLSESPNKRCVYVPDFAFKGDQLELASVGYNCPSAKK